MLLCPSQCPLAFMLAPVPCLLHIRELCPEPLLTACPLQLNTGPAASPHIDVTGHHLALAQAHFLGLATLSVLRIAVAEGLEALEQKYVHEALLAVTRLNNCPQLVRAPCSTPLPFAKYCIACQRVLLPDYMTAASG